MDEKKLKERIREHMKELGYKEITSGELHRSRHEGECIFEFDDEDLFFKPKEESKEDYLDLTKEENQRKYLGIVDKNDKGFIYMENEGLDAFTKFIKSLIPEPKINEYGSKIEE